MGKSTDACPGVMRDVTDEQKCKAVGVLVELAGRYAEGDPDASVDWMEWLARVGAVSFEAAGHGQAESRVIATVVRELAPNPENAQRGKFAAGLLEAARAAGWSDDENEPVIPRFPHPRREDEAGGAQ
ncbi:hypothetical protein [Streptomyces carpinensis]|uniref:Uncharacterized protein n=1 Tax=Streptomyces carpinensis TaxID=66369 RepID=A0ABV1WDQ0_9ACTN|nr:hypothetical protein [Streptomyces carpinensis]